MFSYDQWQVCTGYKLQSVCILTCVGSPSLKAPCLVSHPPCGSTLAPRTPYLLPSLLWLSVTSTVLIMVVPHSNLSCFFSSAFKIRRTQTHTTSTPLQTRVGVVLGSKTVEPADVTALQSPWLRWDLGVYPDLHCLSPSQAISRLCEDKYKDLRKPMRKRSASADNLILPRWSPAIIS